MVRFRNYFILPCCGRGLTGQTAPTENISVKHVTMTIAFPVFNFQNKAELPGTRTESEWTTSLTLGYGAVASIQAQKYLNIEI